MKSCFHENINGTVGLRIKLLIEFSCWDFNAGNRNRLNRI